MITRWAIIPFLLQAALHRRQVRKYLGRKETEWLHIRNTTSRNIEEGIQILPGWVYINSNSFIFLHLLPQQKHLSSRAENISAALSPVSEGLRVRRRLPHSVRISALPKFQPSVSSPPRPARASRQIDSNVGTPRINLLPLQRQKKTKRPLAISSVLLPLRPPAIRY